MVLSAKLLSITNDVADFYHGMREYWSTRTLMQGYSEMAKDITDLVEDATKNSNPLVQACAGSGLAVAKMVGAIPLGIDHWVIETAKSTVHHGVGAGFKTLIGTPIEGFIDGGKFVVNQVVRWSQGEISNSTMGVADEVATTLGTAGLMFLGIKGIHTGGTALINGIKNIELPTQTFATTTGYVMPVAVGIEAISGGGPLAEGLVFMAASKKGEKTSESSSPKKGSRKPKEPVDEIIKEMADQARGRNPKAMMEYFDVYYHSHPNSSLCKELGEFAQSSPIHSKFLVALREALVVYMDNQWAKNGHPVDIMKWKRKERVSLEGEREILSQAIIHMTRIWEMEENFPDYMKKTYGSMDTGLETVLNMTDTPKLRAKILRDKVKGASDRAALSSLIDLAKRDIDASRELAFLKEEFAAWEATLRYILKL